MQCHAIGKTYDQYVIKSVNYTKESNRSYTTWTKNHEANFYFLVITGCLQGCTFCLLRHFFVDGASAPGPMSVLLKGMMNTKFSLLHSIFMVNSIVVHLFHKCHFLSCISSVARKKIRQHGGCSWGNNENNNQHWTPQTESWGNVLVELQREM